MNTSMASLFKYAFRKLKTPLMIDTALNLTGEICGRVSIYMAAVLVGLIAKPDMNKEMAIETGILLIATFTIFAVLRGLLVNLTTWSDSFYLPKFLALLSNKFMTMAHRQSPAFFELEMSGKIANKIDTMLMAFERSYFMFVWAIIYPAIILLVSFGAICYANIPLGIILLILMVFFLILMFLSSRIIIRYARETTKQYSIKHGKLIDSLINIETVKSFGSTRNEIRHYFAALRKAGKTEQKEMRIHAWFLLLQHTLRTLIQVIFCGLPLWFWYKNYISLVDYVFIQAIIVSIISTFATFMDEFLEMSRTYGQIKEGWELINKPVTIVQKKEALPLKITKGEICFDKITYQYGDKRPLFKDFTLNIKSKQRIGLVGRSGSGKSTLIKLLCRYYDVQNGAIKIDGQDIRDVTLESLNLSIALMPQDPSLFNRTIMENIRYGKLDATDEEVYEAAKKAYCHDFIMALPNGYDSKVGERGVMLSGGERQRIAIARAILKNAPILILDEATSALDSESELFIQKSLHELMKNKTVIAIAHRLSTLKEMDKIIVLDKGKITESGKHSQLIKNGGIYQTFYDLQSQ